MAAPVLGSIPTIVTSWFCPFAQRTLIAVNAKKPAAGFQVHEVDFDHLFNHKPQWLLDLNPDGLVPFIAWQQADRSSSSSSSAPYAAAAAPAPAAAAVAAADNQPGVVCIRESLVCNEYLEHRFPTPPLLPRDPVGRAAARLLIQRISDAFVPAFKRVLIEQHAPDKTQAAAATGLDTELTWLLRHMVPEGPLALSGQLSLVDCAVGPHLLRLYILRHYANYRYKGPESERLKAYCAALESHPAVSHTMVHPQGLDYRQELLKVYAHYGVSLVFNHRFPLW